jgi:rhodanese-related sulfurtransferase
MAPQGWLFVVAIEREVRGVRIPGRSRLGVMGTVIGLALAALPALAGHGAGGLVPSYYAEHVKRLIEAGDPIVLVDVRPNAAYRMAHLPGARSIPLPELESRLGEIPRTGRVVLYGQSIIDASDAYAILRDRGWRNVGVIEDGFAGWSRRGFPVELQR